MARRVDMLQRELGAINRVGRYHGSLICTDQGLLIASDGDVGSDEVLAGFASLFDEIALRARRDLALEALDEITVLDGGRGRLVFRPLRTPGENRLMVVVSMPVEATWRRNTTQLVRRLERILAGRLAAAEGDV